MKKLLLVLPFLVLVNYSYAQMVLSAQATPQSCDCYTLTTGTNNIQGGIFSPNTIDLNTDFNFSFEVYLGSVDNWTADGIAFILQQGQAVGAVNPPSFGSMGIAPSLGIEIDAHPNPGAPYNDPAADHVNVYLNGDVTVPVSPVVNIPNIEDGAFHTFNVTWNVATQILQINLDGNIVNAYNADIVNTIFGGNSNVYFGFTGATGGLNNLQQVCLHRNSSFIQDKLTACIGETITFTDNSTSDLNNITNYLWEFADGTTSNLQNPTHDWGTAGVKNVTLTITDISGCTDVSNVDVTITPELNVNVVAQNISCNGLNDGTLTATPLNGTGPYIYDWDLTANVQNPNGLAPNTYTLTLTDNLGCTGTGQGVIVEPTVLSITSTSSTDAACGANSGTLTINAAGGSGNYQYTIDGGVTFQASNVFVNLAAATYNVQVQDVTALPTICVVDGIETVGQASLFTMNPVIVTNVSCGAGANDGSVAVTLNNGAANFTYDITGPVNQNQVTALQNHTFSNLTVGNYTVTITDNLACIVTETNIAVGSATAMVIDYVVTNAATTNTNCNLGNDGALTITAIGGVIPLVYSIDNGVSFQINSNFTGLTANTYNVQVKDNTGCVIIGNLDITEPTPLSIDNVVVNSNASCKDSLNGQITITSSGGNGVYSYSLDGGLTSSNSNVLTGLGASNQVVTLMEGVNCSTTLNGDFLITEPDLITIPNVIVTDVTCNGANDGQLVITADGGTPAYQFSNDAGATFQNSGTFTNLGFGSYDIQVTDMNDCPVAVQTENISETAPILVSLGVSDTTVCFGAIAEVCAIVTGGDGLYSYNWNGVTLPNNCLPIVATTPGQFQYSLIVTDGNGLGCVSNNNIAITKTVNVLGPLQLTATTTTPNVCKGDQASVFAEAIIGSGNGGPYTYTWTNNQDLTVLNGGSQVVTPIQSTIYTVTVSDGCTSPDVSQNVNVNIFNTPLINISPNSVTNGCPPFEVEFISHINQSLIASQAWDFGNGNSALTDTSIQLYETEGCYNIEYSFTTTDGCLVDTTLLNYVCVNPYPNANFSFSPNEPDLLNLNVQFINETTGAITYLWKFGTIDSSIVVSPIHTYPEYGNQNYLVELKAINGFGCMDSITKIVYVKDLQIYYIPNTFSPDDNGTNETFAPVFIPGFIPADYSFMIFDRWGNQVFHTNDFYSVWNGDFNGETVIDGTYVWRISFIENATDKRHSQMGHVNVIR